MRALCLFVLVVGCNVGQDGAKPGTGETGGEDSGEVQDTQQPTDDTGPTTQDADGDGYVDDCDDNNPDVFPGAIEVCDGLDNDCNNVVDDNAIDAATWYADTDGDGFGDATDSQVSCEQPTGFVATDTDCDDSDARYNPGAIESDCEDPADYNCDGSVGYADADGDGFPACTECDDDDAAVNPDALEVCNGADDNCNGLTDDEDPLLTDGITWYADADGDSYGGDQFTLEACAAPDGWVDNTDDCDDLEAATYPSAQEICDEKDNDCDGTVDEGVGFTWYADTDGDGYGDASSGSTECTMPPGYSANGDDCNDAEASTSPAALEVCDGVDNDCDGVADGANAINASTWYADADSDGYGDASNSSTACAAPSGFVADDTDCDDGATDTNPGADEYCDTIDNDCDGEADEDSAVDAATWYADNDGDTYGDVSNTTVACSQPAAHVTNSSDCDDTNSTAYPGATDTWYDGIDSDCGGDSDFDADGDGTDQASDCDDTDPASNTVAIDGDCDGVLTADDCNDADATSTTVATDADCDGVLTAADCNDNDPNQQAQGGSQSCPATSCLDLLTAAPSSASGAYWISVSSGSTVELYCDMTQDDGGWTLVYRNDPSSPLATNNTSALGAWSTVLATLAGGSAKLSDSDLAALKSQSNSAVGYRVTSNNISNRYFAPSSCAYSHTDNSDTDCRRYTATYSTSPTYTQCTDWGGGSGGLDSWYSCNGGGYTNVFNTHRTYSVTAGITTNSSGSSTGSSSTQYGNDVLMWVR